MSKFGVAFSHAGDHDISFCGWYSSLNEFAIEFDCDSWEEWRNSNAHINYEVIKTPEKYVLITQGYGDHDIRVEIIEGDLDKWAIKDSKGKFQTYDEWYEKESYDMTIELVSV